jgi:hypothetical protein
MEGTLPRSYLFVKGDLRVGELRVGSLATTTLTWILLNLNPAIWETIAATGWASCWCGRRFRQNPHPRNHRRNRHATADLGRT